MSEKLDVAAAVRSINGYLKDADFRNQGADPTDFQYGTDPGLRFKTGTVHGEVTVTVWKYNRQIKPPIRITNEAQVIEAKYEINRRIHEFFAGRRV